MADNKIEYDIVAKNKTKPAFDDVNKSAKSSGKGIETEFKKAFGNLDKQLGGFGQKFSGVIKGFDPILKSIGLSVGGLASAFIGLGIAVGGVALALSYLNKEAEFLDNIGKQATRVGMLASEFKLLDDQLKLNGTSMSEVQSIIESLPRKMYDFEQGIGKSTDTLKSLGIEVKDANGSFKSSKQLFDEINLALAGIPNSNTRAAFATKIYGDQAKLLNEYLAQGEEQLKKSQTENNKYANAIDRAAASSKKLKDIEQELKSNRENLKIENLQEPLEAYSQLLEKLKPLHQIFWTSFYKVAGFSVDLVVDSLWVVYDTFDVVFKGSALIISSFVTNFKLSIAMFDDIVNKSINLLSNWEQSYTKWAYNIDKKAAELISNLNKKNWEIELKNIEVKFKDDPVKKEQEIVKATEKYLKRQETIDAYVEESDNKLSEKLEKINKFRDDQNKKYEEREKEHNRKIEESLAVSKIALDELMKVGQRKTPEQKLEDSLKRENKELEFQIKLIQDEINVLKQSQQLKGNKGGEQEKSSKYDEDYYKTFEKQVDEDNRKFWLEYNKTNQKFRDDAHADAISQINENYVSQEEMTRQHFENMYNVVSNYYNRIQSGVMEVYNTYIDLQTLKFQNYYDKQTTAINEWYNNQKEALDNSRMSRRQYDRAINDLDRAKQKKDDALAEEQKKKQRQNAKTAIELQVIQALAAGGLASMELWADPSMNYYTKIGFQIGLAAQTTATVGLMMAQMQQLKDGGIIGGNTTTGDKQIVRANSGELMINKQQQMTLFKIANGQTTTGNGSAKDINISTGDIIIEGNATNEQIEEIRSIKVQEVEHLREMLEDLNFRGKLKPILVNSGAF